MIIVIAYVLLFVTAFRFTWCRNYTVNLEVCFVFSPLALARVFLSTGLGHTVQSFLQEVFSECLGHLGQRIH